MTAPRHAIVDRRVCARAPQYGKIAAMSQPTANSNPFTRFFAHESAGGVVLGIAALAALIVSNSPLAGWYERFLHLPGSLVIGETLVLQKPLLIWVNDLWMAVFFFVVGLEIKRELVEGELASRAQAILPAAAALGGMAVPAGNHEIVFKFEPRSHAMGWTITNIAGLLTLLLVGVSVWMGVRKRNVLG